ncbi:MAG TPA: hypothetical protein VF316_22675 [Polyangiaceae bacterium]
MKHSSTLRFSFSRHGAVALAVAAAVAACTTSQLPDEAIGTSSAALFTNGGFETGIAGTPPPAPWTVQTFLDNGITPQTPQTLAGLNLAAGGVAKTVILVAGGGPLTQPDPTLGAGASLRWPRYGNQCAITNQTGNNKNVNALLQSMTVGAADIDSSDGKIHVRFVLAPVLQNPAHTAAQQPYYMVQVTNVTQNKLLYSDFNLSGAGIAWKSINPGTANEIDYTDWQLVDVAPGGPAIIQGDQIRLEVIAAGCSLGGHFGEVYVDGVGSTIPGVSVEATGPTQANACSNITYTLNYKNGSASPETGVAVDFTTPTNTTFQSINAPSLTCTTPAVGTTGTVTCTVGSLAAGASGSFTVTVNVNCSATGTIIAGNYDIHSTQEGEPLIGPKVNTTVGCAKDTDCSAGNWCKETAPSACTPTLPNGTAIPTDPSHTNPTINGTCTAQAGAVVCTSAVCDAADNKCGYANGDGPCTTNDGGTVCRSAACSVNGTCMPSGGCNVDADCSAGNWCAEATHTCTGKLPNGTAIPTDGPHTNPTLNGTCTAQAGGLVCQSGVCDTADDKCGYADGHGPCSASDGGSSVCRSGSCSLNGTCEPSGGCNTDADCSAGQWCNESAHACTPQLPNGTLVPTDGPHTNPTLNGTCTQQAGALVCTSGVCDTADNECGYANGDGPCTSSNASKVCRSSTCSADGTCVPNGGCNINADCTNPATPYCNTTTHKCEAASDAGTDAGSPTDAGAADTGVDDATLGPDSAVEGFVEGGGVSCAVGRAPGAPTPVPMGLLVGLGVALRAMRRRRSVHSI